MNLSYLSRLLCVCLASFFLIHTVLSVIARVAARSAMRVASRAKLPRALNLLMAMRVLPTLLGVVAVVVLCIPSYVTFEPSATHEYVGVACCAAAALGVALFADSILRSARALIGTWRFARECRANGTLVDLQGESFKVLVVNSTAPILTLAGVFRPQLVASANVLNGLSRDELSAALMHERAHRISRDNLRRLCLLACPRLPFASESRELERMWSRWTEWQADDLAAAEDPERSLSLASALVQIAKMGLSRPMPPLCANFVSGENELEQRVERLLKTGAEIQTEARTRQSKGFRGVAVAIVVAGIVVLAVLQPATLHPVHELLERLIH